MPKNIISLGVGCGVAIYLDKLGIRNDAYPFDYIWCQNLENLEHIILDDFNILMNKSYYVKINLDDPNRIHHTYYNDINDKFNAIFAHHNILLDETYQAFERRIQRFRNLKTEENIFITFIIKYDNTLTENLLVKYKNIVKIMNDKGYNKSLFILVIINKAETIKFDCIDFSDNYKIYHFNYQNSYGCGYFEGDDDKIIMDFFKKITQI
ncbi:putative papain-like cysteine peptidase [Cotonvirus japonicus]|uniref:Papain-like cysteine peptidase n=1 Tax=Cotonvirus japonicus TaxID=2811091 RepID=A0ABM7NSR2_9VIRU|nr:putative papain-like cysteine peptidase [Cotonvirus japonicus]BCS83210.1 putative papain-like cysteine peptidase [Cotonvirus japonicus]